MAKGPHDLDQEEDKEGIAAGMTMTTMKTMTTSLLSTLSLRLTQFYLRIVHSLFFTYLPKIRPEKMQSTRSSKTGQDSTLPDSTPTRQGTMNVSVTAEQILRSDGLERKKWIDAGRKELDNLTGTKTTIRHFTTTAGGAQKEGQSNRPKVH